MKHDCCVPFWPRHSQDGSRVRNCRQLEKSCLGALKTSSATSVRVSLAVFVSLLVGFWVYLEALWGSSGREMNQIR